MMLMDIMMAFMDDWDTIEEITKRGLAKDVVISILTAKGIPDHEKMRGLEALIYDYITKPFDVKALISNVRNMCAM